ncbi:unnamed protein product, partial [Owenia fusiformis]
QESLKTLGTITVNIEQENDNPVANVIYEGVYKVPVPYHGVDVTVEQYVRQDIHTSLNFLLGVYDYDVLDDIALNVRNSSNGTTMLTGPITNFTFSLQNCSDAETHQQKRKQKWVKLFNNFDGIIPYPCLFPNLSLPIDHIAWLFYLVEYTPNKDFVGVDRIQVIASDQDEAMSDPLDINIYVLENKCQNNAVCNGEAVNDTDCSSTNRSRGFEGYKCDCQLGYSGDYCEQNIDECLSSPCRPDYTCVDKINSFVCECDPRSPCAGYPWWAWLIVGLGSSILILIIVVIICKCKKKTKTGKTEPQSSTNQGFEMPGHPGAMHMTTMSPRWPNGQGVWTMA